jgi:purine catabolism regulator
MVDQAPSHPSPVTLNELVRLALPVGTTYLAGADRRAQTVSWCATVGLPLRGEVMVDAGDLVFAMVRSGDPKWERALSELVRARVVGVATADPVPPEAVEKARKHSLALILLPEGSAVREAHRAALMLLINRQAQTAQRAPCSAGRRGRQPG